MAERHARHAGDIGDGRAVEREPVVLGELRFHQSENSLGLLAGRVSIELETEFIVEPRVIRPARDLVLGHHEPLDDASHGHRIGWKPLLAAIFPREIDEDRLGIPQDDVAVFEDRDFAERVLFDQRALLMRAGEKIDWSDVELEPEQRAEQPDLVAIARQFEIVELN